MAELETPTNPVTQVFWPVDVGALWSGTFGSAKVHRGKAVAITSDGKRHPLDD